jgi:hypothetical protein
MAEERVQRRLAAILAADVVGYSRLMEQDEPGTMAMLKARRKEVLEPLVAQHQGRIFKVTGDGVLVEFGSAVNAVQCAVELQHRMAVANDGLPEARRIVLLRVGVNLGDVMVEGGDLYGDGVNIAARLEGIAEPPTDEPDPATGRKRWAWFALDEGLPLFAFAGIWASWHGTRGTKKNPVEGRHTLYAFLTTQPNAVVAPVHSKAMPVLLTTADEQAAWLSAPLEERSS